MTELREMVREALRRVNLNEAKRKPKTVPGQSEEAAQTMKDRQTKATGYKHSDPSDFSAPLGDANLYKGQGASNIGGFTGVGNQGPFVTAEQILRKIREMQLRKVIRTIVGEQLGEDFRNIDQDAID